jgi:hypothetical protein
MTEQDKTAGQGLGIAGLVLGILAIPLGIIPCTFIVALVFGVTGIILSSVGLSQANRMNGAKGLLIAALVCSILGTTIASLWTLTMGKRPMILRNIMREEFKEEFGKEFEKAFKSFGDDMEEVLEDLEEDLEKDLDESLEDTLIKIEEEAD